MIKTMKEIEKLKKVMDEEDVDHVRVERYINTNTNETSFSVGIHKYGHLTKKRNEED